jgi:hypothetical protein
VPPAQITVLKSDLDTAKRELGLEHLRASSPVAARVFETGEAAVVKAGGAYDEANAKAVEIRKADPKIPLAKAMDMVFQEDRALAQRYLDEQRGR